MSLRNDIIKGLQTSLKTIKLSEGYSLAFDDVTDLVVDLSTLPKRRTPLLEVIDAGLENVVVNTKTEQLVTWPIILRGSSKIKNDKIIATINDMLSSIKRWIYTVTPTSIHANVTAVQFEEVTASGLIDNTVYAAVEVKINLIYFTSGTY